MKKKIKGLLFAGAALASFAFSSQTAQAAGGNVMDGNQRNIVGMWVEVDGGGSGWAKLTGSGYSRGWEFNTKGRRYRLHVGVGGTPQRWEKNIKSGWLDYQGNNIQVNTVTNPWFTFRGDQIHVSP